MGVGKSTIGKKLARNMGLNFIDCDQELEKRNGVSVNTIFEIEGESGFRKRESRLLKEFAQKEMGVIATGGGVVTQEDNRKLLKKMDRVVYIDATISLLWSRLRYCKNRPLLQTENPRVLLEKLLIERDPLYREVASHVVSSGKGSATKMATRIEQALNNSVHKSDIEKTV